MSMRVHLRADSADGTHTKFTVFMNGANCGHLCMTQDEAIFFHERVLRSTYGLPKDVVYSSGRWAPEEME